MNFSSGLLSAKVVGVLYPLFFSLLTAVAVIVFIWLMVRFIGKTDAPSSAETPEQAKRINFTALLLILLVMGLILRLIFAFAVKGYRPELNKIISMFASLKNGFGNNYSTNIFPITYYIYSLIGAFANLFGLGTESVVLAVLIKLPLIIADLITAFILFKLTKKYLNSAASTVVAGFVCVCPLFVFASGVWATLYSLLAMFLVLTLYFIVEKNFIATVGCFSAALLCHKDAMFLFPLVAVFVIYGLVKASVSVRKAKGVTFGEVIKNPSMRPVFTVPVAIVGFLLASYLLSLPVVYSSYGAGFFTFIYELYLKPLASFEVFGRNSLGIFNLFLRNGVSLNSRFPSVVFTVLFAVIITGIVLLVYLSKKNRANLMFLGGYIILTLATYFVGFSEFSLLTAIVIFIMAFLLIRDKRIISIFGVLSILVTVNATTVMSYAGYYNNLSDYYVLSGTPVLKGGISAVTIVCSALAVLTHLYATVVLLDISMSNKRKLLPYCADADFKKAMVSFFSLKNK